MTGTDSLELKFGISNRFLAFQVFIAVLGAAAILISPAGWAWKSGLLSVLFFSSIVLHARSVSACQNGSICIYPDGTAQLRNVDGREKSVVLKANHWATRMFSVLAVFEPARGRQYHCVICASENDCGQYRRLLGYLRMRVSSATAHKATWQ